MKVIRSQTVETRKVQVGDQILIKLKNKWYTFSATAQQITKDGIIFMFDECVAKRRMNSEQTSDGGYDASELKKWVETELLDEFPDDIRDDIGYITLPAYSQISPHDSFYNIYIEPDANKRFRLMKNRKNRIADYENTSTPYWVKNAAKETVPASFALVDSDGIAICRDASYPFGIRPIFLLKTK